MSVWDNVQIVKEIILTSYSINEVISRLGFKPGGNTREKVKQFAQQHNIQLHHFRRKAQKTSTWHDKDLVQRVVKMSHSIAETVRNMGFSISNASYAYAKRSIKNFDIDTSHFNSNSSRIQRLKDINTTRTPSEQIFVEDSTICRSIVKKRLIIENIIPYVCSGCNNQGEWKQLPLSLHLDHINGINNDNRVENLRFLCPNCHAQTPTYAGKNSKRKSNTRSRGLPV